MKFERQTIYKKYNKPGDISYLLVLNTNKMGMTFVYFTDEKYNHLYKNIDGLYFKDLDRCVSISRTIYVGWNKVPVRYYEKYRSISNREMRRITTAMKELFDGDIVYDSEWNMCYSDEIKNEISFAENDKVLESDLSQDSAVIEAAEEVIRSDSIKEEVSDITNDVGAEKIEQDAITSSNNTTITQESDRSDNVDYIQCEEYIDLLRDIPTTVDEFKNRRSRARNNSNNGKTRRQKEYRRVFSETEALSIAHMRNLAISQIYNVPSDIATRMKKNALEYFGMDNKPGSSKKYNYVKLFNAGYTLEQVEAMYPSDISHSIRHSYKLWNVNRNRGKSASDYEEVLNNIIERDNLDELIKIAEMTKAEIIEYFKCTSNYAPLIQTKIRRILSKKSILFAVFGTKVFDVDKFNTCIESARNNHSKSNDVMVFNYDTCMRLKDIYDATFDHHQDIIIGAKTVPNCIAPDDVPRFISIIKLSFTRKPKKDHIKNIDMIYQNADIVQYAITTMQDYCVAYNHFYKNNLI